MIHFTNRRTEGGLRGLEGELQMVCILGDAVTWSVVSEV